MKGRRLFITVAAVLAAMLAADILAGGNAPKEVFCLLRIPRALTSAICGAVLALAGAQMQAIFRNPLADPHIMGVSSGAGLGAAIVTLAGGTAAGGSAASATADGLRTGIAEFAGNLTIAAAAAAGALLTSLLIIYVSRKVKGTYTLLVFGVLTGFAINAIISALQAWAAPDSLRLYYSWSAGSFIHCGGTEIMIMAAAGAAGLIMALREAKGLDILLFGDSYAALSGADPQKIRWISLAGCCLVTGAATAFCGPVGFVGIVAPHIARRLAGTSAHLTVLPVSLITGAILGTSADLVSQVAAAPLPAGSAMALIGIPFILYIMLKGDPESKKDIETSGRTGDGHHGIQAGRAGTEKRDETQGKAFGDNGSMTCPEGTVPDDMSRNGRTLLGIRDLTIGYGGRTLCSGISFDIRKGDCIMLCGANGSGKTTLLRTLASMHVRGSGKAAGTPDTSPNIIMIPSGIRKVRGFTLEEFIRTGCFQLSDWAGKLSAEDRRRQEEAMDRLRISDLSDRDISTLSDGEFRKGCIASALCRLADLILLDEPTAFLDAENRAEVLAMLRDISEKSGTAVMFSSHDIAEAAGYCSRVAAIGADRMFRISAPDADTDMEKKLQTAGSIFKNKNITFGS